MRKSILLFAMLLSSFVFFSCSGSDDDDSSYSEAVYEVTKAEIIPATANDVIYLWSPSVNGYKTYYAIYIIPMFYNYSGEIDGFIGTWSDSQSKTVGDKISAEYVFSNSSLTVKTKDSQKTFSLRKTKSSTLKTGDAIYLNSEKYRYQRETHSL